MQPTAKFPQIQLPRILGFKIEDTATERPLHSSGIRQLTTMIGRSPFWLSTIEVLIVFIVFAAMAAVRPPDVNESHYLIKAKHFWNPDWCHNDLFLESTNAHYFFFLVAGWPTLFLSLDVYAWLGRIIVWLAASVAWVQSSRCLGIGRFISPFSAALFVLLNSRFNLAGEWVIGGFEAKSVAYVLVLWSVIFFIRGRVDRFWPALGLLTVAHRYVRTVPGRPTG